VKLKHYYHIYANGFWNVPFDEHIRALQESGLIDALDFVGVGIVGTEANRNHVKKFLPSDFHVVAEAGLGWEQVTHTPLSKDLNEPSKILYTHTKGAANYRYDQDTWRREMTDGTIYHWRECVDLLDKYDAVGCRWRRDPWRHYSGTFWWATSSYLSTLAPISYNYRDDAEAWIGQGSNGGIHAEIDPSAPDLNVTIHPFGRTFVCKRTEFGHSYSNLGDIGDPRLGDEFVDFPATEANKIILHFMSKGATFSMVGNTIVVKSV
jgi:hypothetical protein